MAGFSVLTRSYFTKEGNEETKNWEGGYLRTELSQRQNFVLKNKIERKLQNHKRKENKKRKEEEKKGQCK